MLDFAKAFVIGLLFLSSLPALSREAAFEEDRYSEDFDRCYLGASASTTLPQGCSRLRTLTGAAVRGGYYVTETLAFEAEAAWLENRAGLFVGGLWHWWGYERFDPFFTAGGRGWINFGQVGPCAGVGAFWHLDDNWSLRMGADATLGLETNCEVDWQLSVGFQRSF